MAWCVFTKDPCGCCRFEIVWRERKRVDVTLCHERIFRKREVFPALASLQHLGLFRHRKFRPKKASAFDRQVRICLLAMFLLFRMSHWFRRPDPLATHSVTHSPIFLTDSLNRQRSMRFTEVGRYFPGWPLGSRKWETVNKTGHLSNVFPLWKLLCDTSPEPHSLSTSAWSTSARSSRCSAGIHLVQKAGSLPELMASPWHFYFLCSDVTTGPLSRDNVCFGGGSSAQRSHHWLGNRQSVLTWADLGCSSYLLFNVGLKKTCWVTCEFAWRWPHIWLGWSSGGRSALKGGKKKKNTAGGEVKLPKKQNHPSHDKPQTLAAVISVICALTVGNMAGQLPLGQMTFRFSVMAAFHVLSFSPQPVLQPPPTLQRRVEEVSCWLGL